MQELYRYNQQTGEFCSRHSEDDPWVTVGHGYSGWGQAKNNPALEAKKGMGPVPKGTYMLGQPHFSHKVGPVSMFLTPVGHEAHGRTALMIHGDNTTSTASRGCIILNREIREEIASTWRATVKNSQILALEVI